MAEDRYTENLRRDEEKTRLEQIEHAQKALAEILTLHPAEEWFEEDGDVLWWTLPVQENPYCGSPLETEFPMRTQYEQNAPFLFWSRLPPVWKGEQYQNLVTEIEKGSAL